jgi:hypothetical protein
VAPTINKDSSPLRVFTAVISLLGRRPLLVRSQSWGFHSMQDAADMPTYLLDMRYMKAEKINHQ